MHIKLSLIIAYAALVTVTVATPKATKPIPCDIIPIIPTGPHPIPIPGPC